MATNKVAATLARCIEQSLTTDTHEFQWDKFFPLWFRKEGSPYFFLFRRHLGVTNTQYAELFSLLQAYAKPSIPLLFHTTEQTKTTVVEMLGTLLDASLSTATRAKQIREFSNQYVSIFQSTIAVDMFYCSCAVFLPPGLDVDINGICADSGYIHSAGKSVYVRNLKKARIGGFEAALSAHLNEIEPENFPVPFVVYAHEDFSEFDRDSREQISRGIDSTKLYVEKMSMGSYRLAQIVQDMRAKFADKLEVPEAGSYIEKHEFSARRTIWLICDRSMSGNNPMYAGGERYYICYEQLVKNSNPFYLFDENKPAWKSHTTMPHSLTAALINLTRRHTASMQITDPFGGTGTTWFEVKRIGGEVKVRCSDISPAATLMVLDNLEFFQSDSAKLQGTKRKIDEALDAIKSEKKPAASEETQGAFDFEVPVVPESGAPPYLIARGLLHELRREQPKEDQEFALSDRFVEKLAKLPFETRFLFYIALRAELRYQGGYKRQSVTFSKAFSKSLEEMGKQIEQFCELKVKLEKRTFKAHGNHLTYRGHYSDEVVPAILVSNIDKNAILSEVFVSDARKLGPLSTDIIICDPPYGFNTTEDRSDLAVLYSEFLDAALRALRPQGHLIVCLPAESYTGRDLPYCTRSNLISNQILVKAQALGRQAFIPARSIPSRVFSAPYYWEAERALRRTILHFSCVRQVVQIC